MDYKAKTVELLRVRHEIAQLMERMHEIPLCINQTVIVIGEKEWNLYQLYNSLTLRYNPFGKKINLSIP